MMRISADSACGLRPPPPANDASTSSRGSCTLRGCPGWARWSGTTFSGRARTIQRGTGVSRSLQQGVRHGLGCLQSFLDKSLPCVR